MTAIELVPKTIKVINKYSTFYPNWPNDRAKLWVLIRTVHLIVCSRHTTYTFQSEPTLSSCQNVNKLLAWSRCGIRILGDCNWTGTYNYLVCKRTLNNLPKLAEWFSWVGSTYLYGALTVCSCHVAYAFQSESTLYSGWNVKELLVQSRREMRILSDCNRTEIHNHLVCKRRLNHFSKLTKWLSWVASTYLHARVLESIHTL